YVIRKRIEHEADRLEMNAGSRRFFYIVGLSSNTLIYKGMLTARQIVPMFPDLLDTDLVSALALVHQRFSTNTFPSWPLAHPYRYIAHNGEINTLRGNINWMRAREGLLQSDLLGDDLRKILPVIREGGSDTATFDNVLEFLVMAGRSLPHAILMMIPEPWSGDDTMSPDRRAFYEYHSSLMEPWDGPAAMAFTDGHHVAAVLDRNGLRPARYVVTADDLVVLASEAGALPIPVEKIRAKGRLAPGKMLVVNTTKGVILDDEAVKTELAMVRPYGRWVSEQRIELEALKATERDAGSGLPLSLFQRQRLFGYTADEIKMVLGPMADTGEEPAGSMGNDTPLAVLSERPQLLFSYFRQMFAQVTNPAIDPMRVQLVMSLALNLG